MSKDTIYRQAALDALAEHEKSNGHNYTLFVDIVSECAEIIRDLPPAQQVDKDMNVPCTNAIDRQAAIDVLMEILDKPNHADFLYTDEIYKALNGLPSVQPERKWISRSEKMPESDGTYLVYAPDYQGGSSSAKEWHNGVMFAKFKHGKWSVEVGYYNRPGCVRAWMPLPDPYEEDVDE